MSQVLDFFRAEDKRFEAVSDERLIQFISDTQPEFLEDKEFLAQYTDLQSSTPSLQPTTQLDPAKPAPPSYGEERALGKDRPYAPDLGEFPLETARRQQQEQRAEAYEQLTARTHSLRQMAGEDPGKLAAVDEAYRQEAAKMGVALLEEKSILQTATKPIVSLRNMLPELPSEMQMPLPTKLKIAYGGVKGLASVADFFLSPLGIATLGIGGLPAATQKLIAGIFAADMALHTPELAAQLGAALGEGDPEKAAELTTAAALNTYFIGKTGGKALEGIQPKANVSKLIGQELLAQIKLTERPEANQAAVEHQAALGGQPVQEMRFPEKAPEGSVFRVFWQDGRAVQHFETLKAATEFAAKEGAEASPVQLVTKTKGMRVQDEAPAPATPAEPTAPNPKARTRPERQPDIIDDITGLVGRKLSLSSAREFREDFKPEKELKKLFAEGGQPLDDALAQLHQQGLYRNIQTEDAFLEAILDAGRIRGGAKSEANREATLLEREETALLAFTEALKPQADPDIKPMHAADLYAGDEFEIRGQPVKVKQMVSDEDTGDVVSVLLEGGAKFGEQWVPADQLLYPDAGTFKSKPVDFATPEPEMPDVLREDSVLANAWNQGHLNSDPNGSTRPIRPITTEPLAAESQATPKAATPELQRGASKPATDPGWKESASPPAANEPTVPARALSAEDSARIANRILERIEEIEQRLKLVRLNAQTWKSQGDNGSQPGRYVDLISEAKYLDGQLDTLETIYQNFKDNPDTRGGTVYASKPSASPGGPLGTGPARAADNPNFTVFPAELPEAVRLARDLLGGKYPKVREVLRALNGRAAGVFRHKDATGEAEIELRRDLFDLPPEIKARLQEEAAQYAKAAAGPGDDVGKIERERFAFLSHEALMENPVLALKVLWHEIWHLVDWLPDHLVTGRGNLLGRIASLKNYLRGTIPEAPGVPDKPITPGERVRLMKEAEKQMRAELGPIEETIKGILVDEPIYRLSGVTPEDVKALLGMSAREQMPELYRWFAEQPADIKKAILKAAMKGMVDERLAAMGKKEQIGTEQVYRTVRMKTGREPTFEEIRERFQKLFREEMLKRRMVELKQIQSELEPLIAWWRGTEKMEDYFKPPAEMYAEAGSIFMNNPAAMAERAPTYWKLLHNYMERKPEVKRLYDEIQDQIRSGTVMKARVEELRESWRRDEERSLKKLEERGKLTSGDLLDNVIYHFDRRFGPVYRAAKGYSREGDLRNAIGNFIYRASEHELFLGRINRDVGARLVKAGLDWMDLGEFMFHRHVIENRAALANPMGWAPKNSLERLAEMRVQYGAGFKTLEEAQARFRAHYEEQVVDLLTRANMFGPELTEAINERTFYATFAAVKDAPTMTIERLLQESFGDATTAHIFRQVGNLGEIKNPATATTLKALSLISAAYKNILKRQTVAMLQEMDPSSILPAKTRWTGKRIEHVVEETGKVGTVVYLDAGKPQAFYVRKAIADSVNQGNPVENLLWLAAVKANAGLKGLFTQLNYAFWPVGFVRDMAGWMMQMPGIATPVYWAKLFPRAMKAANDSLSQRRRNPDAEAALSRKGIISRSDPRGITTAAENEFEARLASFGMDPAQWGAQADKVNGLVRAWNAYRGFGQRFERVHKIAGMLYLDQRFPSMPEWKKREIVRERAGSPDFLQRGASNAYVDLFAMFYNPWKEGIRSLAKSARENPWSFGAKATALIALPTVTQAMAASGWFGKELKDLYASVPDYDVSNYLVVPLGWADRKQQKVAYLRLPLWEPARIAHALLWQGLTSRGQGYASYMGGQVPSANPLIGVAAAWWNFEVSGKNPYDAFLGREILDPNVFEAGGWRARQDLMRWTWNELGGGIVARLRDRPLDIPDDTEMEKFLSLPIVSNFVGRWLKVSNRGIADADRKLTEPLRQQRAQTRVAVRTIIDKVIGREALADSEKMLLRDPYALEYFRNTIVDVMKSRAHPLLRRLDKTESKAEKAVIVEQELKKRQGR
jgi:hypothetical protein